MRHQWPLLKEFYTFEIKFSTVCITVLLVAPMLVVTIIYYNVDKHGHQQGRLKSKFVHNVHNLRFPKRF